MALELESCALLLTLVNLINCHHPIVFFRQGDLELGNNSYIYYTSISDGDNALKCLTDIPYCCTDSDDGDWRDETGTVVHQGPDNSSCLYVTRGPQEISLSRKSDCIPDTSGLWRCDIAESNDQIQSIYIYISNDNTSGEKRCFCIASVSNLMTYRYFTASISNFLSAH